MFQFTDQYVMVNRVESLSQVNTYTLFDVFTDNTRGYFTSCVVARTAKALMSKEGNPPNMKEYKHSGKIKTTYPE